MFYTIEFTSEVRLDVEISPKHRLERLNVKLGSRFSAQVKPYVIKTKEGYVEVADLFFDDGTVGRGVAFSCFQFVD